MLPFIGSAIWWKATKVNAGLAESTGRLLLGKWRDSLHVTCGLTACTPGSAPGPMLGNEYGKTLPFLLYSGGHNKPSCSQRASQLASECECVDVRCSQLACDVTYWWSSMRSSAFCRRRESVSSMSLARDCSTQLTHAQHNTAASATVSYS